MNLEKLLASSCRQKILKELSRVKTVNIMGLVRNINSTYVEVNRNIKILEKERIINDQWIGRKRMIKLIYENPKTMLLLRAIKILSAQTQPIAHSNDINSKIDALEIYAPQSGT